MAEIKFNNIEITQHIDITDKDKVTETLLSSIVKSHGDLIDGEYTINQNLYDMYAIAVSNLNKLKEKNLIKLDYVPLDKPYSLHYIILEWMFPEDDDLIHLFDKEKEMVSQLFQNFDEVIIGDNNNTWSFYTTIYTSKEV